MRPWPADTEPRFLRFLLNRVSGCGGGEGVTRSRSLEARMVSSCVALSAAPRGGWRQTARDRARRGAERRCLRLAFGVVSAGAVCFGSRPSSSARSAASRDGWRRRRRPGTRLAAAPRVRSVSCAVHAALALSRALSDGVPRPRSNAKLRPLDVSPEILSLRRSGYAMVTACVFSGEQAMRTKPSWSWTRLKRFSAQPDS